MKVTIENKKGLNKDLKVFIDKKTMNTHIDKRYEEIKGTVNLKGFRPGKVPKEILKRQFGKAVFGEVLDKVIKDTSTKALQENNIKPACQPKLDLKTYGEDKDTFLQNLISNDIKKVSETNSCFASLLTPQGKYLFEFIITKHKKGYFLECEKKILFIFPYCSYIRNISYLNKIFTNKSKNKYFK